MFARVGSKGAGFTGFELLIVIGLVGLLAWLVVSRFNDLAVNARNTERRLDTSIIAAELEAFYAIEGYYPASASSLPSYAQFISQGVPAPDTIAFLDPTGSFIDDSPTASTNAPATGYDPAEIPEGSQYTYAPYGCQLVTTDDPAASQPDAAAGSETETTADDQTDDEGTDGEGEAETDSFDNCQSYIIYAWLENSLVYSKISTN